MDELNEILERSTGKLTVEERLRNAFLVLNEDMNMIKEGHPDMDVETFESNIEYCIKALEDVDEAIENES